MLQEVNECQLCKLLNVQNSPTREDNLCFTAANSYQFKHQLLTLFKGSLNIALLNTLNEAQILKKNIVQLQKAKQPHQPSKQMFIQNFEPSKQLQFASRMHYEHQQRSVDIAHLMMIHLIIVDFLLALFVYLVTALQITYMCVHYQQILAGQSLIKIFITLYSLFYFVAAGFICFNWKNKLKLLQRLASAAFIVVNIFIFPLELFLTTLNKYRGLKIEGIYLLPHQPHSLLTYSFFIIKTFIFLSFGLYFSIAHEWANPLLYNLDSLTILFSFFEIGCYPLMDFRYYMNMQAQPQAVSSVIRDAGGYEIYLPLPHQSKPISLKSDDLLQINPSTKKNQLSTRYRTNSQKYVSE